MKSQSIKIAALLLLAATTAGIFSGLAQNKARQKRSESQKQTVYRLPDDLQTLAGNPDLLKKPEGLEVAAYVFPNYHASALHNKIYTLR